MPDLTCPHCQHALTDAEVQSLNQRRVSNMRKRKGGWPKGQKRGGLVELSAACHDALRGIEETGRNFAARDRVYDYTEES